MNIKLVLKLIKESKNIWKYIIIPLALITAALEIVMLGFLSPVIKIATDADTNNDQVLNFLKNYIDINSVIVILSLFCFIVVITSLSRMMLVLAQTRYSIEIAGILSQKLFYTILNREVVGEKRERIISIVSTKIDVITNKVLVSSLSLVSSCIIIFFVTTALSIYVSKTILILILFIVAAYKLTYNLTSKFQKINGTVFKVESSSLISKIIDVTGGMREIKLAKLETYILKELVGKDERIRRAQGNSNIIGQFPRFIIETLGYLAIIISIYINFKYSFIEQGDVILYLGICLLAIQRLIPLCQQSYQSIANIKYALPIIHELYEFLVECGVNNNKNLFNPELFHSIELLNVGFSYKNKKPILEDFNMKINAGQFTGIVGKSGSGKSTLIDIICGLKPHSSGNIIINGEYKDTINDDWSSLVFLVPQKPTLFDMSILENIVLNGEDQAVDLERVKLALKISKFNEIMETLSIDLNQSYSECKNLLSGGQKQRLALARAIYSNKEIILLDEATNALDTQSEEEFFRSFKGCYPNRTLVVVSHRENINTYCDVIYKLPK